MLWGDWNVCVIETPRSSLDKRRIFRKPTLNGLYTPFGSPVCGGTETSGAREKTALLGARNRYALRLADHQRSSPSCAGWDRLAIKMAMVEFVMTSYSSLSKISIISAAVITCGSFGKCLRLPVTKKESSLLRQTS